MIDDMIKPIIIGDATLYLADCMDVLPTLEDVDCVITDPPYGINLDTDFSKMINKNGFKGLGAGNKYNPINGDGAEFDPSFIFEYCKGTIVLFGYDYFSSRLPKGTVHVWDKRITESADKCFGSPFELLWINKVMQKMIFR